MYCLIRSVAPELLISIRDVEMCVVRHPVQCPDFGYRVPSTNKAT